ncbi:amino acid adenylation domain-containing protein, partial [Pontibacter diazotrophicus]
MSNNFTEVISILGKAKKEGIKIFLEADKLKVKVEKNKNLDKLLIDEVKRNKQAIIDFLKSDEGNLKKINRSYKKIAPLDRSEDKPIPLSFSQERLWFIDRLQGSSHYHLPAVFRLTGKLDVAGLEAAFRQIVERHEALRTVILEEEGQGYQKVIDAKQWQINFLEDHSSSLPTLVQKAAEQPFDLSKDYMLRVVLVKLSEQEHQLIVVQHHISSDGWSLSILVREFMELYLARQEAREARLLQLPIQYADYAVWQREHLQGEVLEEQTNYWKKKLAGLEALQLPTDYVRPSVQSTKGNRFEFHVNKELSHKLDQFSHQEGTTLFMSLLSAFNVLLYRYSGQEDICVGSPIAGRVQPEVEPLIGFFVNTLALRNDMGGNPNFKDLLARVKDNTLEAYAHQDLPFEKVVEAVGVNRDMSRSPLFQVVFTLENSPEVPQVHLGDLTLAAQPIEEVSAKFDLTLSVTNQAEGLKINVEYCTDLFSEATVKRMMAHYERLLSLLISEPATGIDDLLLLDKQEVQQLVEGFNPSAVAYPQDKTLVSLFEEQTAKAPDAVAVVCADEELTYAELNARANQLAHYLQKRGVGEETLVPVCIDRSIELVTALLGILKAGGAYVPIDPSYPQERIRFMLEDTDSSLILSSSAFKELLQGEERETVLLDTDWQQIAKELSDKPAVELQPSNLAYVIYTSGSTGKPKGVLVEHGGVVNLCSWHAGVFSLTASSRSTMMAGVGFDASAWEVWPVLVSGASLYIVEDEQRLEAEKLLSFYADKSITHSFVPTALVDGLVKQEQPKGLALEYVLTGGDQLRLVDTTHLSYRLVNNYGPTENTVVATSYTLPAAQQEGLPPIGKPISNTTAYVVDKAGKLVPQGVAGELCIGGAQVARGYLNREELTQERFVKDPFSKEAGARMYRTGDLVRWLSDGNLEFLGRVDDQVKVRGYRIELGEVESVLGQCQSVEQAVVIAKADANGSKRLIGYVVAGEFDKEAIIRQMKRQLPEYMVPSLLVELEEIPLTSNGKVNKKALPEVDASEALTNSYVAPRTETEEKLVAIWQELLQVERVGVEDNFFELGGHSLLATRLQSMVRKALEAELQIKDVFAFPTIAALAQQIASSSSTAVLPAIVPFDRSEVEKIPLSFSQERLWFIDRLQGSSHYHLPAVFRLKGDVDVAGLENAFRRIVERHEALRTVITEEEGQGFQKAIDAGQWQMTYLEDASFPNAASLRALVQKAVEQPFDLGKDFMLRAVLVKLSEQEHLLVVVQHHIASDGWSVSILVKELTELYAAKLENREAKLPQLPVQFADYAVWQREYLQGEVLEQQKAYWKNKLSGVEALQLPTDHVRPSVQSTRGSRVIAGLGKDLSQKLEQFSNREGVTLYMSLLSAYKVLLYRYSGQEDICVGSPIAGRVQPEVEPLIGFFVNTLALRSDLGGSPSFRDLLKQVKETTLDAYKHQDLPFEKVVEAVGAARDRSRSPLFQVMFTLENTPEAPEVRLGELSLAPEAFEVTSTKFDLTLSAKNTSDGIQLSLEYCTDLFSEETAIRMMAHYQRLLSLLVEEPGISVDRLPLLDKKEAQQLLEEFNATAVEYPQDKTLVDLFEEQVAKTPDAVAVVFGNKSFNYKQLNERADQLAHYLQKKGLSKEMLVPICVDRSLEMLVGLWGILKAGGAYVPIDPSFPQERIHFILKDTGASLVISSGAYAGLFKGEEGVEPVLLDTDWKEISRETADKPVVDLRPKNLAYVIYTSGSTGRPKGVLIEHRSAVNYLLNSQTNYTGEEESASGSYQHLAYTFDASVTDLLMPLLKGKSVVLAEGKGLEAFEAASLAANAPYSFIKLTPAHLPVLAMMEGAPFTKRLVVGGEALQIAHVQKLLEKNPELEIINEYGPTEATVGCSTYRFKLADLKTLRGSIAIGKPLDNTQLYIVDQHQQLVPVGMIGEICIGGDGLARGYLNLPELTAEKFVKDPFSKKAGARMYRTGDLARWLEDGNIEYLGRIDDQVKIRGYRIELGEVESVLGQCQGVEQAVVIAKADANGSKRLIGYVVPEGEFNREAIISQMKRQLPEYMVPSLLVELEEIPLTSNGKVNKKALPEVDASEALTNSYVAPRTETEEKLVAIWQELLQVERVGVEDNFFELGGHSLLATRLQSMVRKALEAELQIKDVFAFPTIAALAQQIASSSSTAVLPAIVPFDRSEVEKIPLSFSQERLWFIDRLQGSSHYHLPAVFRLKGDVDVAGLENAFRRIVERHEALRTVITEEEGQGFQKAIDAGQWQMTYLEDASFPNAASLRALVQKAVEQPFDLGKDFMLRAVLVKLSEQEHLLVVVQHHIASDGWSVSILVKELTELYAAKLENRESKLPQLPVQFADYAVWQREYLQGEVLEQQQAYWKNKLSGVEALQLLTDHARPSIQSTRGNRIEFSLNKELSQKLEQFSKQEGSTLFMSLLSAFKVLLYRYSGQEDICVGSPIAGRVQPEVEPLIGFFVNTLALRSDLGGNLSFKDLLKQVKDTTLDAYKHQDLPFEKVVEAVGVARDRSRTPLFQVMFTLDNTPGIPEIKLGELSLAPEVFENTSTKFDLTLSAKSTTDGIQMSLEYCTDLFSEETVVRMMEHYQRLLSQLVSNPEAGIDEFALLGEQEVQQLTNEFNATAVAFPQDKTLLDLFEHQVARTPDAVAVVFEGEELTYTALNSRSNQLAYYLQRRGVGQETLVPVCIERSLEMIIGLWGILKAGGAYVPIDPNYPQDRIRFMLEDTQAALVISSGACAGALAGEDVELVLLDRNWEQIAKEPAEKPATELQPSNLAYVIYTSGSTGRPKGVLNEHRGVVNRLLWAQDHYGLTAADTVLQKTTFSFDVSVWELFWPSLVGSKIVFARPEGHKDSDYLKSIISSAGITTMHFVPSMLEAFLLSLEPGECSGLVRVLCSGEALKPAQVNLFKQKLPGVGLYNLYGPTEAAIDVSFWDVPNGKQEVSLVPIGKPVANTQLYVLDKTGKLVPQGVAGELCIAGVQVARGYLNRPELTEEKFVKDIFSEEADARMYRTGDLVRWLPDGNLEYLGRFDDQVKIRGYRIELGEVESVLCQCQSVQQAVVIAKEDASGSKRLIGYVVAEAFGKEAILKEMKQRLPEYMVPSILVALEEIPLTANGKANRKALPEVDASEALTSSYLAPRTETEQKLAAIWQDLLQVERVGAEDNFFELGGDSIITIQLVSRARKAGFSFQPRDVFEHQTVASLAAVVQSDVKIETEQGLLTGAAGLLPIQQWFFEQDHQEPEHFNQALLLQVNKALSADTLQQAIKSVVARHDALRFNYTTTRDGWQQEYGQQEGSLITEDLSSASQEDLPAQVTAKCQEYQQSLELEDGELMRAVLLQTPAAEEANRLFLVIHHLAVDGVSWRILLEDIEQSVEMLLQGKEVALGEKGSSYRQWQEALQVYAETKAIRQKAYWQRAAKVVSSLPVDKESKEPALIADQKSYSVSLSPALTQDLLSKVHQAYHTQINDLLLAALARTIVKWSKQEQVVIGLEGHGREDLSAELDINRTVGWFTNLYPVPLFLKENLTASGIVQAVKEQLRQVPDKGMGYGALRYLHPDVALRNSLAPAEPLQIIFNYLGQVDNALSGSRWFAGAEEASGQLVSPANRATSKLDINSRIVNGQLHLEWRYADKLYEEATIVALAKNYLEVLTELIAHCKEKQVPQYTPSDYGLTGRVDYEELEQFLQKDYKGKPLAAQVSSVYGLSPLQEGLLFHGLYDQESQGYVEQMSCRLKGLVVEPFKASWEYLLRKHTILRSSFHTDLSIPVQCVHKALELPFELLDFREMPEEQQQEKVVAFRAADSKKGFDYSQAPLFRLTLIRLSEEVYEMVWTHHHLLVDGWSTPVLMQGLLSTYDHLKKGGAPVQVEEDRYEDFIRYLQQKDPLEAELFWKEHLAGVEEPSLLPFVEHKNARNKGGDAYRVNKWLVEESVLETLQEYAQANRLTLNTLVQGVWAYLLASYTGQQDVVYGVTVAGRPTDLAGAETRVGLYINTLPLRSSIAGEQPVKEWLTALQEKQTQAREHSHTPLPSIQQWLGMGGNLFDTILVFENYPVSEAINGDWGLQVENLQVDEHTNFPLSIVVQKGEQLSVGFSYNAALISEEKVMQIKAHFAKVMQQIISQPELTLSMLELVTEEEQKQLLEEFNPAFVSYPEDKTLVDLFEEHVAKAPDALAVAFGGDSLTYGELNARANKLAHYLRKRGVGEETLVPVCLDRSIELVTALLGIQKAGGAYVPIDPSYPQERIQFMLEDTNSSLVLSSSWYEGLLSGEERELVLLDSDWDRIAKELSEKPAVELQPSNLAYVIYTSGSTGKPKGVLVEHGGVVNLCSWHMKELNLTASSRSTMMAGVGFDASAWEVWPVLVSGASLYIVEDEQRLEAEKLLSFYAAKGITQSFVPTALVDGLVKQEQPEGLVLQYVLTGGDQLRSVNTSHLTYKLVNNYGPTENTVVATSYTLPAAQQQGLPPIGKPLSNTSAYVLDKSGRLVPQGVAGELCIGGVQVARGYLNRAELSAEKFVQDPFSKEESARMYKTGDLVRWLEDGNLEFLGRVDDQVKIRGYRIELGEVESVLQQCENVQQAVVIAKADAAGHKRLIGYVVSEGEFEKEAIISQMKTKLPEYMVPSMLVELEKIPLTANGKVNRKALPEVDASEALTSSYIAPRTETEEKLATIWQELLQVERVGVEDNFFELGGDSIITIQLVSRARRAGFNFQPRDVFEHQTIASLARVAAQEAAIKTEQGVLTGAVGLLPIQQWFFEQEYQEPQHFNMSLLFEVKKTLSVEALDKAVKAIVARHDALRFRYKNSDGVWEQEYSDRTGELLIENLTSVKQQDLSSSIAATCEGYQQRLDLEKGELFRIVLLQTPEEEEANRLFILIHHLAVDGVSWRILLEDLEQSLQSISQGSEVELGAKSSSYRQWQEALQHYAETKAISQKGYWQKVAKAPFILPVDKESAAVSFVGDQQSIKVVLDAAKTQALLSGVHQAYNTQINDFLLAALARTLSDWSRQEQVVIGLEGHGREDISAEMDISRTMGWFTNLYPVLLSLGKEMPASDVIQSVKEQLRQIADKGLGYGALRYLHPDEELRNSVTPTNPFQVVFNYLGQLDNSLNSSQWFAEAGEPSGRQVSPANKAGSKLEVNSSIANGQLSIDWRFSVQQYHQETIAALADLYLAHLSNLISHSQEKTVPQHTPSDFGLTGKVGYKQLEVFLQARQEDQISRVYGLSPLQEGLLFHGLYDESAVAYVEQMSCRFSGLDVERFQQTWKLLLQNHSILRTSFHYQELDIPVQCVHDKVELPFTVLDYSKLSEEEQERQLTSFVEADKKKGFDFSKAPLLRLTLIRLSGEEVYQMIWTYHHLLLDGWSLPILLQELLSTYEAMQQGKETAVLEEDRYEDFIRYLQKKDPLVAENFWNKYLQGVEEATLLPFVNSAKDRNMSGDHYGEEKWVVEEALQEDLQQFAQKQRLTLNTLVQGVWAYLLYRYTGQQNPVYGVTVAGRPTELPASESRIGLYINTLPLHAGIKEEQRVVDWLTSLQEGHSQAREHAYTPLSSIQHWLGVNGDFFDTLLVFENYPVGDVFSKDWGLQVDGLLMEEQTNYPLTLTVQTGRKLTVEFGYKANLLSQETVARIKSHFAQVLEKFVRQPESALSQLEVMTAEERQQLASEFNAATVAYPQDKTLVDLFEEQVAKTPDAIAVLFEGEEFTYAELSSRSNQLAHYLQSKGVGEETLVPICIDKSPEMIVGLLGVMKAGGAYVPIDPGYPQERIQFMLQDTSATLVVSSSAFTDLLSGEERELVLLDTDWEQIAKESSNKPATDLQPDNLAYVIYTSGSTGRPKGVLVEHKGVVNLVSHQTEAFGVKQQERILQLSNYAFDASVEQIFLALCNGAGLVLVPKEVLLRPDEMVQLIEEREVTHIHATPSFLQQLTPGKHGHLRRVIAGGEVCPVSLASAWGAYTSFYNEYGPTETTVTSTEFAYATTFQGSALPIGRPLANTPHYVLDKAGRLVPQGVVGELCIGGVQVARGYLNREELTAEKFVADPFSKKEGARMYRTGDLVRWSSDGNLEYLGRMDDQVKIRGYRIELGEVESMLNQCGGVEQAVVIAREDANGSKRLIGYVVSEAFDREAIIKEMKQKLPEYMVPSMLIELEEIPLTSNGKVDKKALPEVDASETVTSSYVAPRNETEEKLAAIWKELLQVERVGVNDNFFELGGDSIITIQLVSRARRAGFNFQPRNVFEHQTIALLAAVVQPEVEMQAEQGLLTGTAGLLPIQQRFFQLDLQEPGQFNQSLLFKVSKALSADVINKAVRVVVERHDALRFAYQKVDGVWQQEYGTSAGELLTEDLRDVPVEELTAHVETVSNLYQQRLDLENGELLKAVLLETPEAEEANRLFLVIHHLAVDGVSWRILLEDLELSLEAISKGKEAELGIKGSSYRQWHGALQHYAETKAIRQQGYWQKVAKTEFILPIDKDQENVMLVGDQQTCTVVLDASSTQALLTDAQQAYHTQINDLLLAALAQTLSQWSRQEQVVIGLEGHGREDLFADMDISRTVGWFTNIYPVLLTLKDGMSASAVIQSVKEQLRQLPDKGMGYGALRYLHPDKKVREDLALPNVFQLVFNYLGQVDNALSNSRWFAGAGESCGNPVSPANKADSNLEVNSSISNGQLHLVWRYSSKQYHQETIENLATRYLEVLTGLISHCKEKQVPQHTPSDYGLGGNVTYQELEQMLQKEYRGKPLQEQISSVYGLSPLQGGILFHSVYEKGGAAYVEQMSCRMTGLQVEPFRESWQYLVQKHSILRSSFHQDMSVPVQCVHKELELPFEVIDYRHLPEEQQQAQFILFREEDKRRSFDFSQAPLLRITLLRLTDDAYHMVWTHHHLLVDGWSMPILMQELLSTYDTLSKGGKPVAVEEDRYEDFIRHLQQQDPLEAETFWRKYLSGVEEASLLPFVDSKKSRTKGGEEYRHNNLTVGESDFAALQAYAQVHRLTANTLVQGVWAYLLSCYTGQQEPVYGVTVAGRPAELAGAETRVGMYINTLPLHTTIAGDRKVSEWLLALQEGHTHAREYAQTPLSSIHNWVGVRGDLFDTLLVFENYPVSEAVTGNWGLQVEDLQVEEHTNYPLSIIAQTGKQLSVDFSYNASLLSDGNVERIKTHFASVLQQIVSQPELSLSELALLTEEEHAELVEAFNPSAVAYPQNNTLVELFEEQVAKAPDAVAVNFGEEQLTYGELNARANQLAHYLQERGVKQETLVPVCLDRSVELVTAQLGILKAGGAYVPIDPSYPRERIRFMLEDTHASLVLSGSAYTGLFEGEERELILLDTDWDEIAKESTKKPAVDLQPSNLAYVIYTSGSTGKPKGVLVEHGGVVNLCSWHMKEFSLSSNSRSTMMAGVGFDASAWEVWPV